MPAFLFICSFVAEIYHKVLIKMDVISKITHIIEPAMDSMGYSLVLVKFAEGGKHKTLTIMAERKVDGMMSIEDCTEISRTVSALWLAMPMRSRREPSHK